MFLSLQPDVTKQEFVNGRGNPRWWEPGSGRHRELSEGPKLFLFCFGFLFLQLICIPSAQLSPAERRGKGCLRCVICKLKSGLIKGQGGDRRAVERARMPQMEAAEGGTKEPVAGTRQAPDDATGGCGLEKTGFSQLPPAKASSIPCWRGIDVNLKATLPLVN